MARIADKCASWLVPVALLIAVITGIATNDIVRAVTVLVVFCPCALVLATPTAIMATIGQATKHGVIIKSGEALEKMGKVDTIAFDKTGTLTYGKLEVSNIISFDESLSENALLSLTACAEAKSEHPLGKAIVSFARNKKIEIAESEKFKMTTGKGIFAVVSGEEMYCGNEKYLIENGVALNKSVQDKLEEFRTQGKASILIAKRNRCIGVIALSDTLRPEAKDMVSKLAAMQTNTVLLTGDNKKTADYFAKQVGIQEVHAELLPEEKVSQIANLQSNGKTSCFPCSVPMFTPAEITTTSPGFRLCAAFPINTNTDLSLDA